MIHSRLIGRWKQVTHDSFSCHPLTWEPLPVAGRLLSPPLQQKNRFSLLEQFDAAGGWASCLGSAPAMSTLLRGRSAVRCLLMKEPHKSGRRHRHQFCAAEDNHMFSETPACSQRAGPDSCRETRLLSASFLCVIAFAVECTTMIYDQVFMNKMVGCFFFVFFPAACWGCYLCWWVERRRYDRLCRLPQHKPTFCFPKSL